MIIIEIAGHLGSDPESRFTPNGQKVTTFRVATNVRKGGKDETVWWRVTIWGDRFDRMMTYLKKGSAVIVVGDMNKPEIYNDKEGHPQISLEVTAEMIRFSPFGKSDRPEGGQSAGQGATTYPSAASYGSSPAPSSGYQSKSHVEEDEIPF
ncbi:MAG: Single-stranded DNA-binding protein [Chlamydiales bacterium]|jgi:single-strand DNA-binding protein|nr:Single-stranded DNA-binding protein [Chlamydiales bacterium]